MLRTKDALRLGIHPRTLYDLRNHSELVPVARGLYRLATDPLLSNPDWIAVAVKVPRAVICLISALSYHELTTQVPDHIDIALPSHGQVPKLSGLPVRPFWFPDRAFAAGIEYVVQDRVRIRIYSPEKTIADFFSIVTRSGLILQQKHSAITGRRYAEYPCRSFLKMPVSVMRPYLEGDIVSTRDLGASVRQRLLNQAKSQSRPFQEVLQYYAMERFLYRLACSAHVDEFILKGALLLPAWRTALSRSTMDIDLPGKTSNKLEHIRSIFSEICVIDVEPDGTSFDAVSLEITRIKEVADYEGVRVHFNGILARARIPMQIDIGFGDVVVPETTTVE